MLFPILLFITAITSIVIYLRTSNDIFAILGAGMAGICLIWGLVIAHWSIHLLALAGLLLFVKPVSVATLNSRCK